MEFNEEQNIREKDEFRQSSLFSIENYFPEFKKENSFNNHIIGTEQENLVDLPNKCLIEELLPENENFKYNNPSNESSFENHVKNNKVFKIKNNSDESLGNYFEYQKHRINTYTEGGSQKNIEPKKEKSNPQINSMRNISKNKNFTDKTKEGIKKKLGKLNKIKPIAKNKKII